MYRAQNHPADMLRSLAIDDVAQQIEESTNKHALAYVYFDYKDQDQQTPDRIIRLLLAQILCHAKSIPLDLESFYDKFEFAKRVPSKNILEQHLLSLRSSFILMHLFFDALDECSDQTVVAIVDLIGRCKDSGMKVFFTTRLHLAPRLNAALRSPPSISLNAHKDDLQNYLTQRLKKDWRHSLCEYTAVVDHIAAGAQGK